MEINIAYTIQFLVSLHVRFDSISNPKIQKKKTKIYSLNIIQPKNIPQLQTQKKMDIILMGDSNSGRSSIAKIIFQKMMSKQTMMLGQTNKIQNYQFKIQKLQFKVYDFPTKYDLHDPAPSQQMILKNAYALIYVINPQSETFSSLDSFVSIYDYMRKKNSNNCQFFIFINKADLELTTQDAKDEFLIKHKKKLTDEGVNNKLVSLYFTSILDSSVFQAFSSVVQKILPCTTYICKLLNKLASYCKIDKIFIFDISTKLFIAHNDDIPIQCIKYQICSQMIDIYIDISALYYSQKKQQGNEQQDRDSTTSVKLNIDSHQKKQYFILQELQGCLCIGYQIKDSNYDRPYLIESGLFSLLSDTTKSLR